MKDEEFMFRDCLKGGCLKDVYFSNNSIFVRYFIHHDKSIIFRTAPEQTFYHVTITRCLSLSVGDEPCIPALDHFELIDFYIVGISGGISILK